MNADYSFAGLADLYLKPYNAPGPARPTGNISKCDVTPTVKKLTEQNYGRTGGMKRAKDRITGVAVAMVFHNFSLANLGTMLRAGVSTVASGTVLPANAEAYTAHLDSLIQLQFINPDPTKINVKDATAATTYVLGTDYKVTGAGIVPLSSGSIAEGASLKIDYAYSAQGVLEAFTQSDQEFALAYDGINEIDNDNVVVVNFWRMKPNTVKTLALIGDNLATIEVNADLLIDSTRQGPGMSQYFTWKYASASA